MEKCIVITTINEKTEGIAKFEGMHGWHTLIVGDEKTPEYQTTDSLIYLSVEKQKELGYESDTKLPHNHYTRKNIGYLYAISQGADAIYDSDDDNLPYPDWGSEDPTCRNKLNSDSKYVNTYRYFSDKHVWPRGFPLDHIFDEKKIENIHTKDVKIGVWQGLADNDPDVDAVYRLVIGSLLKFNKKPSVYLDKGVYCPFNSQNTFWNKSAFPLLYLPATVSFRFTDVLRGYVAQRLLWEKDLFLGFTHATVCHKRNNHDLMNDFRDEVECYLNVQPIVATMDKMTFSGNLCDCLVSLYENLCEGGFVDTKEIEILNAWVNDYHKVISECEING